MSVIALGKRLWHRALCSVLTALLRKTIVDLISMASKQETTMRPWVQRLGGDTTLKKEESILPDVIFVDGGKVS